jgi:hypothetical protein
VFQGKFETADSITGEVESSPLVGDTQRDDAVVEAADIRRKAASPTR